MGVAHPGSRKRWVGDIACRGRADPTAHAHVSQFSTVRQSAHRTRTRPRTATRIR